MYTEKYRHFCRENIIRMLYGKRKKQMDDAAQYRLTGIAPKTSVTAVRLVCSESQKRRFCRVRNRFINPVFIISLSSSTKDPRFTKAIYDVSCDLVKNMRTQSSISQRYFSKNMFFLKNETLLLEGNL